MNLYLISQKINDGYDTYDSAVVAALTEKSAREIHPRGKGDKVTNKYPDVNILSWAPFRNVVAEYIGKAEKGIKRGVICASFNA